MSRIEYFIIDEMKAEKTGEKSWIIHLSNGKDIVVEKEPEHNGWVWDWRIGTQLFSNDEHALRYLEQLIREKLTGIRVLFRPKRTAPDICGVEGCACRSPGKCNTGLCMNCPVADKFFADRDGVELVYAL